MQMLLRKLNQDRLSLLTELLNLVLFLFLLVLISLVRTMLLLTFHRQAEVLEEVSQSLVTEALLRI